MPGCVIWPELVWCASASNLPPRRFSRRPVHEIPKGRMCTIFSPTTMVVTPRRLPAGQLAARRLAPPVIGAEDVAPIDHTLSGRTRGRRCVQWSRGEWRRGQRSARVREQGG